MTGRWKEREDSAKQRQLEIDILVLALEIIHEMFLFFGKLPQHLVKRKELYISVD